MAPLLTANIACETEKINVTLTSTPVSAISRQAFRPSLLQGTLIKRYKRFFVDIRYKNQIITGHCPNTGSMMGLLNEGAKVWFSETNKPSRKLKYYKEVAPGKFVTTRVDDERDYKNFEKHTLENHEHRHDHDKDD